jgi:hypothetical protein
MSNEVKSFNFGVIIDVMIQELFTQVFEDGGIVSDLIKAAVLEGHVNKACFKSAWDDSVEEYFNRVQASRIQV